MGKFIQAIESIEALEAHQGKVLSLAISGICDHITALYQRWIKASRFLMLSTVGPDGTDASLPGRHDFAPLCASTQRGRTLPLLLPTGELKRQMAASFLQMC